ncbi:helix-turn-helix domain-containing protein [Paracoccus fontiphilus]|uniref:HTH cro/C1-type domain-containing protein n=1 Tax=Paracoccus fontiphilus TaxID=1815556 RepID=A0ABV7IJ78_9RHOB|nr:helix-turn-helix transcriptional regulator [Paracoccus fontiphilus]
MNDEKLLATMKAAQAAGWWIIGADAAGVEVGCYDCGGTCYVPIGGEIPALDRHAVSEGISSGREACALLAAQRETIGVSAEDLSALLGQPPNWVRRYENPDAARSPGTTDFLEWAALLGVEVHLVPTTMPSTTLRWISMTRQKLPARRRRFEIERKRDAQLRQGGDPLEAEKARLTRQQEFLDRQLAQVEEQMRAKAKTCDHAAEQSGQTVTGLNPL